MRCIGTLSAAILLLWVGLALAATQVYYSVCPFGTGNLLSGGSPTIVVDASGNATLTLGGDADLGQAARQILEGLGIATLRAGAAGGLTAKEGGE